MANDLDSQFDSETDLHASFDKEKDLVAKQPEQAEQLTPEEWTKLQSFGQGALQGATLGYSDEILGALQAAGKKVGDVLPGKSSGKSLTELYQQYRDMQRAKNQAAEDAHSGTYLAGNVAGGIGGALLAPEALGAKTLGGAMKLGAATGFGASDADMTKPTYENIRQGVTDTALGAGIGALAHGVGKGISKLFNPESLEKAGSKAATDLVKINPVKEIPVTYDEESGRLIKQFGDVKGTGKTAVEAGAVPMTGGMENAAAKAQDGITQSFRELKPVLQQTQQKLNQDIERNVGQARPLDYKVSNYLQEFFDGLPDTTKSPALRKTILEHYEPRIEKILQSEGNLQGLTDVKKELYSDAVSLAKNIYKMSDQYSAENEASFLKGLAHVVKSHVEDLANQVDPQAASQIKNINGNISKLITYQEAATKQIGKESTGFSKYIDMPTKILTGYTPSQLGKAAVANTAIGAAKALKTPAGELVQKTVKPVLSETAKRAIVSPFTQESVQSLSPFKMYPESSYAQSGHAEATQLSSNLYNATDDSLKNVATSLKGQPGLEHYGKFLEESLNDKNSEGKNRAIFLIMQNPAARRLVTPEGEK